MTLHVAAEQFTTVANVRAARNCGCVNQDEPSDAVLNDIIDQASDALALVSGGRVTGRRTITVRPCRQCWCGTCTTCELDGVPLPGINPVVDSVKIDGVALAATAYKLEYVDAVALLVKTGTTSAPTSWPSSQKLWRDDTGDDTFAITYTHGAPVTWLATQAANEVTCEFTSMDVRKTNSLPKGTVAATMGGVTASLEERVARLGGAADSASIGPATSQFLSVYAPGKRGVSDVWSPELEYGWTLHRFSS